jgi:hypothetical protein
MLSRTLSLLLAAIVLGGPAAAQTDGIVRGVVTSAEDGEVLQGANVILTGVDSDIRRTAVTDANGFYEIRNVVPARYRVRTSYVGFATHQDTLDVSAERRSYNVALSPTAQRLDEVRVEVERGGTQRQAGLQTVGAQDLDRIPTPGPGGDLASYLQTLPGVVAGGDRGGGLNIRGGKTSQNLFLVDNLPLVKPLHISNFYSSFPQGAVKGADVYAGGFGAEYMGKISAVVDVTLRKGNMQEYAGSASVSPFVSSARVEGPIEKGRQSFLAIVRRSTVEETGPLLGRDVPLSFYDVTGRYSLQREGASCSLTGLRTHDKGRLSNERNTELSWSNTAVGGRCLLFGTGLDHALKISAGYTRFENSAGRVDSAERTAGLQRGFFDLEQEREMSWGTLQLGMRAQFTSYKFEVDQKFTFSQSGRPFGGALNAFGAVETELGEHFTFAPSLGFQIHSRTFPPTYEPRLRLTYRPDGTDQQEVSLALGKYHQMSQGITDTQDAGTEFTIWTPEPVTDTPPRALHGILGYQQQILDNLDVSVEGYVKDIANIAVPEWSVLDRFETDLTPAGGLTYGVDARVELTINSFYLFAGYGWSRVTYEAAQDDLGAWIEGSVFEFSPSHDQRHQVNVVSEFQVGDASANLSWEFGSGRPYTRAYGFDLAPDIASQLTPPVNESGQALVLFDEPYGERLPSYHRLDASVSRPFDLSSRTTLEAKVGAINVYDRRNIFYYDISRDNVVNQIPIYPYMSITVSVN